VLALFRINDPFRLVLVALVALLLRLPLFLTDGAGTVPQQHWLLLGEQLAAGKHLYLDVWDHASPLLAGLYWMLVEAFGKQDWACWALAWALLVYQAGLFNRMLVQKDVYNEKTYVPALLYVACASASPDFYLLSPALLSTTFLLLMLRRVFELSDRNDRGSDEDIFSVGLYLGMATLAHFPTLAFLGVVVWGVGAFRAVGLRQLGLIAFGLAMPWCAVALYYFYLDALPNFYQNYVLGNLLLSDVAFAGWADVLWMQLVPVAVAVAGVLRAFSERGFVNFQVNCQRVMVVWMLCGLGALLIAPNFAVFHLLANVPAAAFFATHYFLLFRRPVLMELAFLVLLALLAATGYGFVPERWKGKPWAPQAGTMLRLPDRPWQEEGRKVLVLGVSPAHYRGNALATPFLNWELASDYLSMLDNYAVAASVQAYFAADPPDLIVDQARLAPELFRHLPLLEAQYRPDPALPSVYRRDVPLPQ
jgi:hypothetical protein